MRLEEPLPPDLAPEAAASITCFVEEADDVWTLYSLIEKGDEVSCNTTRKVKGDNPRAYSQKKYDKKYAAQHPTQAAARVSKAYGGWQLVTERILVRIHRHEKLQILHDTARLVREAEWNFM